ncbi:MAG: sigma-54-dependent Fis family transcriptional regulator [Verrucomicrobia bacterium]|nr:sigma-54-dependent Fis family transcriptional regulator [Verrucomicrobiota bacterium]
MLSREVFAHTEEVQRLVRNAEIATGPKSRLIDSWRRSLASYGLDPSRADDPRILTSHELREIQTPLERFLTLSRPALERLYERVREAGYVLLFTDTHGITVEYFGNDAYKNELRRAGLYLGSCWSESEEGTNGPGTCIEDNQPITIHKTEHFRAPNTTLTCSAAPIFAPQGELIAVADASALYSPDEKKSQALVLQMVMDTAKLIEKAHFIDVARDHLLLRLARAPEYLEFEPDCMLAVDGNGKVIYSTRDALGRLGARSLETDLAKVFDASLEKLVATAAGRDSERFTRVRTADGGLWYLQIRPPELAHGRSRGWSGPAANHLEKFAGRDSGLKRVVQRASRLIHFDLPLVLHGESGCGKERFAHALHLDGPRAGKPFVTLNCAAIPESLIESELFGYREGAFTGAKTKGMQGKVIMADGGTLFLDEIGDMPLSLQSRLLRVLSEREVLPLGADKPLKVDVRVICATHRDLLRMVHAGIFREDLYYRLSGVVIYLPAVRDRDDLPDLLEEVLNEEIRTTGIEASISREAKNVLEAHAWPGNLREMHHVLRYALSLCDDRVIFPEHLPEALGGVAVYTSLDPKTERARLQAVLEENGWRIGLAAKALGVARSTLYRQMDRFHIIPPNRAGMGSSSDKGISRG